MCVCVCVCVCVEVRGEQRLGEEEEMEEGIVSTYFIF